MVLFNVIKISNEYCFNKWTPINKCSQVARFEHVHSTEVKREILLCRNKDKIKKVELIFYFKQEDGSILNL